MTDSQQQTTPANMWQPLVDPDMPRIQGTLQEQVGKKYRHRLVDVETGEVIPLCGKDGIGSALEEPMIKAVHSKLPSFVKNPKTQEYPDAFNKPRTSATSQFDKYSHERHCHEFKAFGESSCAFDISKVKVLIDDVSKPGGLERRLNGNYHIFNYEINDDEITIKAYYSKRIWEIVAYDGKYPLTLQAKKPGKGEKKDEVQIWENFRPCAPSKWNDTSKTPTKFVDGLIECVRRWPQVGSDERKDEIVKSIQTQRTALGI